MESNKSLDVAVEIQVSLDHGSHQALYQQIADRIWSEVIDGTLEPGQRLPTIRQLAVNLGCRRVEIEKLDHHRPGHARLARRGP